MRSLKYRAFPFLLLLNLVAAFVNAQSQGNFKISGNLTDDKGQPLSYATVTLRKATDSTLVKGTLSSADGTYIFDHIPSGSYMVNAAALGYKKASSIILELSPANPAIEIHTLTLQAVPQALGTVTITANKPIIERKNDRTVVNVENSILAAGNSALEILARSPGVTIDKDDNISLNGKSGVNIMINGKMSYLSAAELAILLRSTDGNTIKSIELLTNPSAKNDAAGNAGIINLNLKKNTLAGTNGNLAMGAGYGKYYKENTTFTLNHKQGNLNLFSSFSHSDSKTEFDLNQHRVVTDTLGSKTYFDQSSNAKRTSHNNSYRFGGDLVSGARNTAGFLVNGYFNTSGSQGHSMTDIGQQQDLINTDQDQQSVKSIKRNNFSFNLNDNLKLDTLGQFLSADLDYSRFNNGEADQYYTNFYLPDGTTAALPAALRQQTPTVINIRTFKAEYSLPLTKQTKLEAGVKYSSVKTDNMINAQSLQNSSYMNDNTLTNRFVYDEKIAAGYISLSQSFHNTSLQAGLRAEHTSSDGDLLNTGSEVKRNYTDFFPNFSIDQRIDDKNDINFSYSKRVDRPEYDNLNPFIYYLDQYSYSKGNPFLNPQYTNKVEFSYTYNHSLNLGMGYSHTNNYLAFLPLTNAATKITVYTTLNFQKQDYYNINFSSPYVLTKWWTGNVNGVTFYSRFRSDTLLQGNYDRGLVSVHLEAAQYFQLAKTYKAELMVNYDSPLIEGAYHYRETIYSDLGFSHVFANKKANLKLSVTDLFNSNRAVTSSNFQTNDITLHVKAETRVARLTFTYNFGDSSLKSGRHVSGAADEKSRVAG